MNYCLYLVKTYANSDTRRASDGSPTFSTGGHRLFAQRNGTITAERKKTTGLFGGRGIAARENCREGLLEATSQTVP